MTEAPMVELAILPAETDGLVGACCSLAAADVRARISEWRRLRDRAVKVERREEGIRLHLRPDEPMDDVARLVALESACCPFYRFTIEIAGHARSVAVDAGPRGAPAVAALLGVS